MSNTKGCGKDGSPTSKRSRHKDGGKATDSPNKGGVSNEPIVATNIMMGGVPPAVDCNSKYYEYLWGSMCISDL